MSCDHTRFRSLGQRLSSFTLILADPLVQPKFGDLVTRDIFSIQLVPAVEGDSWRIEDSGPYHIRLHGVFIKRVSHLTLTSISIVMDRFKAKNTSWAPCTGAIDPSPLALHHGFNDVATHVNDPALTR